MSEKDKDEKLPWKAKIAFAIGGSIGCFIGGGLVYLIIQFFSHIHLR